MRRLDEDTLRSIVKGAVYFARHTSPENVCDEAVVQRALKERFVDGQWRSEYFLDQGPLYVSADEL